MLASRAADIVRRRPKPKPGPQAYIVRSKRLDMSKTRLFGVDPGRTDLGLFIRMTRSDPRPAFFSGCRAQRPNGPRRSRRDVDEAASAGILQRLEASRNQPCRSRASIQPGSGPPCHRGPKKNSAGEASSMVHATSVCFEAALTAGRGSVHPRPKSARLKGCLHGPDCFLSWSGQPSVDQPGKGCHAIIP